MAAIIECRGVTKIYRQGAVDVPALRGVDLDVAAGDFATLSGPSGSGKTTLLSLIGGLDAVTAGEISVDGARITGMPSACRRPNSRVRSNTAISCVLTMPMAINTNITSSHTPT